MSARTRIPLLAAFWFASAGIAAPLVLAAAGPQTGEGDAAPAKSAKTATAVSDAPLAPYQEQLLELAFDAASKIPVQPQIKRRSKLQGTVITTCFQLEQPKRALAYTEKVANWRKGIGYGEYAYFCATHGATSEVDHYADLARRIAESHNDDDAQDWERDRILAQVAGAYLVLGKTEQASKLEKGMEVSESNKVDQVKAGLGDAEACDRLVASMDQLVLSGTFDQIQGGLDSCAQFYKRFYDDQERRTKIETKMKSAWKKLPTQIRIDLLMQMAGFANDHKDPAKAVALLNEADAMVEGANWPPEDRVPLEGRLAGVRFKVGDTEKAKTEVEMALAMFDAQRTRIWDIYRARALRPIAEAYQVMGDTGNALRTYIRAVEAGVENPNSVPRAEDLAATCLSMATHGVAPDGELTKRLTEIFDKLGNPW